jgi:hypothetical protein
MHQARLTDTTSATTDTPANQADISRGQSLKLPKTTGERYYDVLQFLAGKAFIVAISAVIAYEARYGKEHYGKVPNYLKRFQTGFEKTLNDNPIMPLGKSEVGRYISGAAASTTLTMWGGNLFAPFLKWFENNKEKIANHYNKKHGKPGEVEIAHERLKDLPKQNWMDVIKGRVAGWVIVCGTFIGADLAMSKNPETGMRRLAQYEEWFGRKLAGVTKAGKEIANTPITKQLTKAQSSNKTYRYGRIIALDFFATSAAIIIWNAVSRMSAKKRSRLEKAPDDAPAYKSSNDAPEIPIAGETLYATLQKTKIEPRVSEGYAKMASEPAAPDMGM